MKRRKLRIGLLWHSVNSDNFGVGALTLANIEIIRRVAAGMNVDVEFVIVGWKDDRAPYVSGPDIFMVPLRPREHFLQPARLTGEFARCDVVFDIGYGDSFADLYGAKRFLYFLATKIMVLSSGTPLVLSPQTIGPFRRPWARLLAAQVMKRARAVVARDRLSLDYLHALGVERNCHESIDVAFELPSHGQWLPVSGKVRVGINVSGLLYNEGPSAARRFGLTVDYAALTRRMVDWFASRNDCEVHLLAHVLSENPVEDDRRAINHIAGLYPKAVVAPAFGSPVAAKSYISAMDFFIGARMHACIAAFSSGVPVLPLAYSRKFSGLFGSLGYDNIADCTSGTASGILAQAQHAFESRSELRGRIEAGLATARERAEVYESVIARRLEDAIARAPRGDMRRAA